jgi:hypothetical protein
MAEPKQKQMQNISYRYLLESVLNPAKAYTVLGLMNETLEEFEGSQKDQNPDSDMEEKYVRQLLLGNNITPHNLGIILKEAFATNRDHSKKIINDNFDKIIASSQARKDVPRL